jgi:hypothetical protein
MKLRLRVTIAALICLLAAPPTAAAADPSVDVIEYGLFATGGVRRIALPQSVAGEMNLVSHVRLIRSAKVIAAQPGRSFGWRYRLRGVPPGASIVLRTQHPALTNPKTGRTMAYSERRVRITRPEDVRYTGYTFDNAWEMAEGEWRFQVLYDGRVIGERAFKIVVPLN